uniref:SH3 domain-containing protein n=1 Tax=Candidatus Enterococcus willemsii TaxID=1857215 RepID=UPI00403EFAE3
MDETSYLNQDDPLERMKKTQNEIQKIFKDNLSIFQQLPLQELASHHSRIQDIVGDNFNQINSSLGPLKTNQKVIESSLVKIPKINMDIPNYPFDTIKTIQQEFGKSIALNINRMNIDNMNQQINEIFSKANLDLSENFFATVRDMQTTILQSFSQSISFPDLKEQFQSITDAIKIINQSLKQNDIFSTINAAQTILESMKEFTTYTDSPFDSNEYLEFTEEETNNFQTEDVELDYNLVSKEGIDYSSKQTLSLYSKILVFFNNVERTFGLKKGTIIEQIQGYAIGKVIEFAVYLIILVGNFASATIWSITETSEFENLPKYEQIYLKEKVREIERKQKENPDIVLRLVIKDIPLFSSNRRDSQIIGQLYLGDEVQILQKKRNWIKIKWTDEENSESMVGWTFNRYLRSSILSFPSILT